MDRVASIALAIEIIDIVYMSMIEMTSVASCNLSFSGLGVFVRIQPDWFMLCGLWPMTGCHCSD